MLKRVTGLLNGLRRAKPAPAAGRSWHVRNPADIAEVVSVHRLNSIREVRQPLLLISEVQRSGGTFLSQLLDGHPQIYAHPYELTIGRPKKYFWPKLDLAAGAEVWWENLEEKWVVVHAQSGYTKEGAGTSKEEKNLPFIYSQPLQRQIFIRAVSSLSASLSQRQILDAYATSYFNAWVDYQGLHRDPATVKYWSAFTPRLTMPEEQCAAYFRDYPDGFLVSVIRNPLSWFASARRHLPKTYPLEEATEIWLDSTRSALRNLANYPGRVALLHFDDLVKNTEATMRALCARTGLEFHTSLLVPTFNGLPMPANTSFKAAAPGAIVKASVDRGQELDAGETAYIRERAEAMYREALDHTLKAT